MAFARKIVWAIGLIMLAPSLAGAERVTTTFEFAGTVKSIEILGQRATKALLVHPDPRFLLVMQVDTVAEGAPFVAGSEARFAIHSPAQLLLSEGAKVRLLLERSVDGGRISWLLSRRP